MTRFRIKGPPPVYRRAGLSLSDAAWLETDLATLGPDALAVLLDDPVVVIQQLVDSDWKTVPPHIRKGASDLYRAMPADSPAPASPSEPPAAEAGQVIDGKRPAEEQPDLSPEPRHVGAFAPPKAPTPRRKAGGKPGR